MSDQASQEIPPRPLDDATQPEASKAAQDEWDRKYGHLAPQQAPGAVQAAAETATAPTEPNPEADPHGAVQPGSSEPRQA